MLGLLLLLGGADPTEMLRARMVETQIEARGIADPAVLAAMRKVPRHAFIPASGQSMAYEDHPVPIGAGQTISQPYIVAFMSEALQVRPGHKVLEVGTGSGYQAAVLAELGAEVYTIEILEALGRSAAGTLESLGYRGVHVRVGDGYQGWPEAAPFDRIIVTAAPDHVPQPLVDQLAVGGRMIIPVGGQTIQHLTVLTRDAAGVRAEQVLPVLFVPMTGEAQRRGGSP